MELSSLFLLLKYLKRNFFFWLSDQIRCSVTTLCMSSLKGFEVEIFIIVKWKKKIPSVVHLAGNTPKAVWQALWCIVPFLVIYLCVCLCVQIHGFKEIQSAFLQSGLLKLLVKKCSKGTGFSKTWLLRDLEVRKETFCKKSGFTQWHERLWQYTAFLGTQDYFELVS